jgi:Flp pilus assembly pilin Flp
MRRMRSMNRDQAGMVTMEHALLLAAFTLPMYITLEGMLRNLATYFGMMTFYVSIPLN